MISKVLTKKNKQKYNNKTHTAKLVASYIQYNSPREISFLLALVLKTLKLFDSDYKKSIFMSRNISILFIPHLYIIACKQ